MSPDTVTYELRPNEGLSSATRFRETRPGQEGNSAMPSARYQLWEAVSMKSISPSQQKAVVGPVQRLIKGRDGPRIAPLLDLTPLDQSGIDCLCKKNPLWILQPFSLQNTWETCTNLKLTSG